MRADQVIIEPIVSEKSNILRDSDVKKYTFSVHLDANKHEIMYAIKELFGVMPESCNTMVYSGKPKASHGKGGMNSGRRSSYKKAIVTMKKGDKISALEVL